MYNSVEWRLWTREKEELEETMKLILDLENRLGKLSQASNPDGLADTMFNRREYGQNNVDKAGLETSLYNLRENIGAGITEYEEYLKEWLTN